MSGTMGRRQRLNAGLSLIALMSLSGCATFGGNVRGDFSCAAPDGICAPSSTIDDRALSLISGDGTSETPFPASDSERRGAPRTNRAETRHPARLASGEATRTQERVLRIVFQPYIDARGRLHETGAVHAVVARGEWQQHALLDSSARSPLAAGSPAVGTGSLADAVDRVDPPAGALAAVDPDVPDPAAVAAARARRADPIGAIKADVSARLAPKADGTNDGPSNATSAPRTRPFRITGPALAPVAAPKPTEASSGTAGVPVSPPQKSTSAQQAVERVKADPAYRAVTGTAAPQARRAAAAAEASAQPSAPALGGTVKATGFPAAVPGEN